MLDQTKGPLPLLLPGFIQIQYICLVHLPSYLVIQLKVKHHRGPSASFHTTSNHSLPLCHPLCGSQAGWGEMTPNTMIKAQAKSTTWTRVFMSGHMDGPAGMQADRPGDLEKGTHLLLHGPLPHSPPCSVHSVTLLL